MGNHEDALEGLEEASRHPRVRRLADGLGFTEGPVIRACGDIVVTSIDGGVLHRIGEADSEVLSSCGGGPNGATEGFEGSIYIAQNGGQWLDHRPRLAQGGVQVLRADGHLEWLTIDPITPNDLCFGPDGMLYVTDPTRRRQDDGRLWRVDPDTGSADLLVTVGWYPNGIAFGPEDEALYVADTAGRRIMRFPLMGDCLGPEETAVQMPHGRPDGFAFDVDGNFIIAALAEFDQPDDVGGLQVFTPSGALVEVLAIGRGRTYTNLAIASDGTMIVTDSAAGAVLAVDGELPGLPLHPFR